MHGQSEWKKKCEELLKEECRRRGQENLRAITREEENEDGRFCKEQINRMRMKRSKTILG